MSFTASGINYTTYLAASKGLHIVFIILILLSNVILLFKVSRQNRFLYSTKCIILISLAFGDAFCALFSLVAQTKAMFQEYPIGPSCSLSLSASVYEYHLLNFVYGAGLVTLCAEYVHRRKTTTPGTATQKDFLRAVLISSVPWFLGLIIVLPLTMAGVDLGLCQLNYTLDRLRAQTIVSTILPAVIAVCISSVLAYGNCQPGHTQTTELNTAQRPAFGYIETAPPTYDHQAPPYTQSTHAHYPVQNQHLPAYHQPSYQQQPQQISYQPQQMSNYSYEPSNVFSPQKFNGSLENNGSPYYTGSPQFAGSPHNTGLPATTHTAATTSFNERYKILTLAVTFFFLVMPQAVFYLAYTISHLAVLPGVTYTALTDGFMYLMLLRPVITPIITSQSSYLKYC
ncbi:uncharacterized protein LOC131956420 [Physella acuta]|uniref:uncharacterized protein LOC131956420 n=1 Tax=Physella acuta TaxID=109671 RepID=UPI0027DE3CC7|nr:uncharacterized protein LOC131956420 [Physella acuta]